MRSTTLVTLCVAALAVACVVGQPDEEREKCDVPNDCAGKKLKDTPICAIVDIEDEDLRCVECVADGDCPPNHFCTTSSYGGIEGNDDALIYTCQKYSDPIGKPCDPAITIANVEKGDSEDALCALVTKYDPDTKLPEEVQWQGVCINNKCEQCIIFTENGEQKCGTRSASGLAGSYQKWRMDAGINGSQDAGTQILAVCTLVALVLFLATWIIAIHKLMNGGGGGGGGGGAAKADKKADKKNDEAAKRKEAEEKKRAESNATGGGDDGEAPPAYESSSE